MPESQTAPANVPVVNPTPADMGLPSAEAIAMLRGLLDGLEAATSPKTESAPAPQKSPEPNQAGTDLVSDLAVTDGLAEVAGKAVAPVEFILRSGRFWVAVGSGISVVGSQLAGLPSITQVCLTALGIFVMITRTMRGGK